MIEIKNLTKRYKNITAVNCVNLNIEEGKIFTFLGENGSGKSTLISMICGLTSITDGEIKIFGEKVYKGAESVKKYVSVVPQQTSVCLNLNVRQNLEFICEIYGYGKELKKQKVQKIMEELTLTEYEKTPAKKLSGGCLKRLSIGMSVISAPKILVLDEPTANLDVRARKELWEVIKGLKKIGTTVIYTTHYMDEAEELSDAIAVMSRGKLLFTGSVSDIKKVTEKGTLEDAYLKITEGL